jgi:hypothetical protein
LIITMNVTSHAQEKKLDEEPETYFPQQLSARDLLTACVSSSLTSSGRMRQRYCRGFVSGVEEAVRLLQLRDSNIAQPPFCVPSGTTARELANAFIRHASGQDKDLERPSASVVLDSLLERFPC